VLMDLGKRVEQGVLLRHLIGCQKRGEFTVTVGPSKRGKLANRVYVPLTTRELPKLDLLWKKVEGDGTQDAPPISFQKDYREGGKLRDLQLRGGNRDLSDVVSKKKKRGKERKTNRQGALVCQAPWGKDRKSLEGRPGGGKRRIGGRGERILRYALGIYEKTRCLGPMEKTGRGEEKDRGGVEEHAARRAQKNEKAKAGEGVTTGGTG